MTPLETLAALPPALALFIGLLAPFCIAVIVWAVLPRRSASARRDADIERQIASLRRTVDRDLAHRPRVRSNTCATPPATHIKAAPRAAHAGAAPKPCGGGLCRKRIDCADAHCPGVVEARLQARSAAKTH